MMDNYNPVLTMTYMSLLIFVLCLFSLTLGLMLVDNTFIR